MKNKLILVLLLPLGLMSKFFEIAINGARDIENKWRFRGSIIDVQCCINNNTIISNNCHILSNTILNNCRLATYSYVGRNSLIQNTTIGAYCSIANNVCIGLGLHPIDYFSTSPLLYRTKNTFRKKVIESDLNFEEYKPIVIGNDVWIGACAIILDGVNIGDGAIIAANAVVTKDIPAYSIVGGVPSKIIAYRFEQEKIRKLLDSKWWDLPIDEIHDILKKQELV